MSSSIRIQVSAPGKVILFGEHSVVYNKTAVAASLNLRTTGTLDINISNQSTTNGNISFTFADIQLEKQFSIQSFQNFLSQSPDLSDDGWEKNLQYIDNTILNSDTSFSNNVQRLSCRAFILLFWHILSEHKKAILPFHFVIKSQLSIGAGMGSSASFAVVLAASLLKYRKFIQTGKQDFKISDVELNLIQDYSMLSERLAHEKPSGIDNAICTFGGVIAFQKQPPRCERITLVKRTPLDVIFVNSAVSRETSKLVGKVRDLQTRLPHVMQSLMETFDQIALEAINQLKSKQGYDRAKLEDLIRMNHGLLRGIDVSHPKLEEIVSIAEKYRCACKLTGAGGGGFAYILSPTDVIQLNKLTQDLKSSHFQYNILNLGGEGVKDDTAEIIL